MAATKQVLSTTELLELILLQCPVAECTRAERISHFWQAVIVGSHKIKRHMFLEPELVQEMITEAGEIRRLPGPLRPRDRPYSRAIGTLHPALGKTRKSENCPGYDGVTVVIPKDFGKWTKGSWEDAPLVSLGSCKLSGWRENFVGYTGASLLHTSAKISARTLGELRDNIKKSKYSKRVFFYRFAEGGSDDVKAARARSHDAAAAAATADTAFIVAITAAAAELKGEPEGL